MIQITDTHSRRVTITSNERKASNRSKKLVLIRQADSDQVTVSLSQVYELGGSYNVPQIVSSAELVEAINTVNEEF